MSSRKSLWKCRLENGGHFSRPQCANRTFKCEWRYGNIPAILENYFQRYADLCCHNLSNAYAIYVTHYDDVTMNLMASHITSLTIVYSTVYSDADQRKHQSSASLVFVWGIHRDRWIPRTKGQLRGKCFHLMTSSWLGELILDNSVWKLSD